MITGIISYCLIAILVMTAKIHIEGEEFYSKSDEMVRSTNEKLKEQLKSRKISPMVYVRSVMDKKNQRRFTIWVNIVVAPIISPLILLYMAIDILTYLIWKTN